MANNIKDKEELEKRILERLKKQVFEKDEELKNHQNDQSVREATKDALAEMTALEKSDVDKMYQQIKNEELQKQKQEELSKKSKRNTFIGILTVVGVIVIGAAYFFFRPAPVLYSFAEDFESKSVVFADEDESEYRRSITDGAFLFENRILEYCYWNSSPVIEFPENYTITVTTTWKNGAYGSYGINLINNNSNYMCFSINKEGATNVSTYEKTEFKDNDWDYKVFDPKITNTHTQRIEVRGDAYSYYVDSKLVRKGYIILDKFFYIGCRICDYQTIAYEDIKVVNYDTKEVILDENFDESNQEKMSDWDVKNKTKYNFFTENGKFVMNHQDEKYCHRTEAFLPESRKDEKWELSAEAFWKEGQPKDFGILFITSEDEIGELMINSQAKAVFKIVGQDNKISYESAYTPIGFKIEANTPYKLSIRKKGEKMMEFFVNNKKVIQEKMRFSKIEKIGLIACGEQIVEFDNVKYEEK